MLHIFLKKMFTNSCSSRYINVMKKVLFYILINLDCFSFASEFTFEETTISMQFYFEQANTIFKSDSNFIVGAFVKRDYQLISIGGTATIPKPTTMGLVIYGQDNEVGTALEGEKIIFAGMNIIPRPRCEMILTPIDKEGNEVDVFFHQGAIKKAHTWKNETVSFEYPSIVCGLKNQVSPPITTNIPAHSVSIYKSNNSNLLLNVSTGGILSDSTLKDVVSYAAFPPKSTHLI